MSYSILYGKQFVRLANGEIIPMILAGDNNVYEISRNGGNGRRARDWQNQRYYNRDGRISETPEAILKSVDDEFNRIVVAPHMDKEDTPDRIREHFGYYASLAIGGSHTSGTTFSQYRNIYVNGIRNAMTLEQLNELGISLCFTHYHRENDGAPVEVSVSNEADYFAEMAKWAAWQSAGKDRYFSLSFGPSSDDEILRRLRAAKPKTPAAAKKIVEQDHYFVLGGEYGFLVRYSSRGFRYSDHESSAKKWRTEKEAETYRLKLVREKRHKAEVWHVKRIERVMTFAVAVKC